MKKHRALHWALAALCAAMFSPPQDGRADPDEENPQAATLDPGYAAGKKAIEARDWGRAIESQVQRADARHCAAERRDYAFRRSALIPALLPEGEGSFEMQMVCQPSARGLTMDDPVVGREILVPLGRWQPEARAHRPCRLKPGPRTRASR